MSAGCRADDPGPFAEPWEAQVFALVVSLQERGLFTQEEWASALGRTIRPEGKPEAAADYGRWLATLEALLAERQRDRFRKRSGPQRRLPACCRRNPAW